MKDSDCFHLTLLEARQFTACGDESYSFSRACSGSRTFQLRRYLFQRSLNLGLPFLEAALFGGVVFYEETTRNKHEFEGPLCLTHH